MLTQSAPVTEIITEEVAQTQQDSLRSHTLRHDALLVLVTLIWGSTFLIVKNTVRDAISGGMGISPVYGCCRCRIYPFSNDLGSTISQRHSGSVDLCA